MAYSDQQMSGNKIFSIIIVALIHVVVIYALVTGLAYSAAKKIAERMEIIDVQEEPPEEEPPPPPPPDKPLPPPPVVSPPPIVRMPSPPPPITTTRTPPPVFVPTPTVAPPPPPPAAPSKARAASVKGRWTSRLQENYPSRAQREEREGTVRVNLTIGSDGRVTACRVSSSSGHADLDEAACSGMMRYGRFDPALDDAGNPTTGSFSTSVRYEIPR